jgi:hypothetical protein
MDFTTRTDLPASKQCLSCSWKLSKNRQSAQSYSATLTRNSKSPHGAKAENFEEEEEASCQASAAEKASEEDPTG